MFGHFSKPRVHDDICSKSDMIVCSSLLADHSCQDKAH